MAELSGSSGLLDTPSHHVGESTNGDVTFAKRGKLEYVKFKQSQTLGEYFVIYPKNYIKHSVTNIIYIYIYLYFDEHKNYIKP